LQGWKKLKRKRKKKIHTPDIQVENGSKFFNISLVLYNGPMESESNCSGPQEGRNAEELGTVVVGMTEKLVGGIPKGSE
jgi:hypothetical protein